MLTFEKNLSTGVTREYAYLNNQIIGWKETDKNGNSVKRYAVTDLLGSVTTVTDESGTVLWSGEYTAFGNVAYGSGDVLYDGMYTGKDIDSETGLTYHWNRWRSEDGSSFISEDPARDGSNWYGFCGNNPINSTDPTGLFILRINEKYNMSVKPLANTNLGNSSEETFRESGCYITTFANVFYSSQYYGLSLENSDKYNTPDKINDNKSLFKEQSGELKGREVSMNALFGQDKWDYWTKDVQGTDGLIKKINEYSKSDEAYMIVGIFDLSSDTEGVVNHMVGLSEGPNADGKFDNMTITSNGDINRGINVNEENAYTIDNLKEIRVIYLED